MKKSIFYFAIFIVSFQTASAQWWSSNERIKGNGNLVSESRTVSNYEKVTLNGFFDMELVGGKEGDLKVEAESNLMEHIITEVSNGTLKISTERGFNLNPSRNYGIKITVPFESINAVSLSGSGEIYSEDKITAHNFDLNLSGSGEIELIVEAKQVDAGISGSGEIQLKGNTNELGIALSGSGDVDASNLQAESVNATVSGSGDIEVFASETLSARVSGSGDITYSGNPEKQDFKTSGSGSVSKE